MASTKGKLEEYYFKDINGHTANTSNFFNRIFVYIIIVIVLLAFLYREIEIATLKHNVSTLSKRVEYNQRQLETFLAEINNNSDLVEDNDITFEVKGNFKASDTIENSYAVSVLSRLRRSDLDGTANAENPDRTEKRDRSHRVEVIHLEVESAVYSLEITEPGAPLHIWAVRHERRTQQFGTYENNGYFRIEKKGLYFIYSQMTYYDNSGRWCHTISRNDHILVKCLASEWGMSLDEGTQRYVPTVHNCYTSIVVYLQERDRLSITSLYQGRTVHHGKDMSFWGIVKLA